MAAAADVVSDAGVIGSMWGGVAQPVCEQNRSKYTNGSPIMNIAVVERLQPVTDYGFTPADFYLISHPSQSELALAALSLTSFSKFHEP